MPRSNHVEGVTLDPVIGRRFPQETAGIQLAGLLLVVGHKHLLRAWWGLAMVIVVVG